MLRCGLCMGYGARARVHVGICTEVEPIWSHPPSLAPVSLPSAALEPLPCAHLAQNPPSLWMPNAVFYPVLRHRELALTYISQNIFQNIPCLLRKEKFPEIFPV